MDIKYNMADNVVSTTVKEKEINYMKDSEKCNISASHSWVDYEKRNI